MKNMATSAMAMVMSMVKRVMKGIHTKVGIVTMGRITSMDMKGTTGISINMMNQRASDAN